MIFASPLFISTVFCKPGSAASKILFLLSFSIELYLLLTTMSWFVRFQLQKPHFHSLIL
jgi:hypothetical protein